ncbi:hypothetical protein ZIOFF_032059 [Zingiber officinale]|uniref:Sm domain-containing protein n=1 Tax=Zingiber officinale TaxID=94328 RepID=A0A8J5GFV5_ZINOF|nr:hypothetical protein ZIOFF_032059 [Zingiber officinale]
MKMTRGKGDTKFHRCDEDDQIVPFISKFYVCRNLTAALFPLSLLIFVAKMLFFSYFKELVGKEVTVEQKNDLAIRGSLHSVDQYLNIKLENIKVVDEDKYPYMWTSTATRSSTYSTRRRGKKPCAALGVAGSSSTASISSTTPGSNASSRCRINLVAIYTPTDYHTRPLDTIFSNFIDALPVVLLRKQQGVIHFSTYEVYGKMIGSFLPNDHPLRKNKKERKKVCEVDILKKDPEAIREKIEKLERMSILIVLFFLD